MKKLIRKPYRGHYVDYTREIYVLSILTMIVCLVVSATTLRITLRVDELDQEIDILTDQIEQIKSSIEGLESVEPEEEIEIEGENKEAVWPKLYTEEDAVVLAKMLYGEARGIGQYEINGRIVSSKCQQAAVIWAALNRYDAGFEDTIIGVVTAPMQFVGYCESNPVDDELMDLVTDVLDRWNQERHGETDVGRVLPADYFWFRGDGKYNHFRNDYYGSARWAWELEDVYG